MPEKAQSLVQDDRARLLRMSRKSDEPAIRHIFAEGGVTIPSDAEFDGERAAILIKPAFLVCEIESAVVGALCWRSLAPETEIFDIAVRADERRRGHASFLLSQFILLVSPAGIETIFLEVRESNAAAIALYQKFGFLAKGRRPSYYRNPTEAAVLMQREID
jgi:ribosomal-protein-alanine acetyltransferase